MVVWQTTPLARGEGVSPTLAFAGDKLHVAFADGKIHSLEAATGRDRSVRATAHADAPVWLAAADDGRVLLAAPGRRLMAIGADGEVVATAELESALAGEMAAEGEHVYFADEAGTAHAIRTAGLQPEWNAALGAKAATCRPCLTEERVYVGSSDGHVHALDRRTGRRAWKAGVALPPVGIVTCGGLVVVATARELVAFDEAGGGGR
jgi:outer membrane protein assembly factor BamB